MTDMQALARDAQRDIRHMGRIQGWLEPFTADFILTIGRAQQAFSQGAVAEIGVHHGKLFFVLAAALRVSEKALAIDVFDNQQLNVDRSGKGDKAIFLRHAKRVMANLAALKIIEGSSLDLKPADILDRVGRVRLFSIDGGHTRECAYKDLCLAEQVLTDDGVVAMDDVFTQFFPEVAAGFVDYLKVGGLVPFALTPGKVHLCWPATRETYLQIIRAAWPHRMDKMAGVFGHDVQISGVRPWTLRRAVGATATGRVLKRVRAMVRPALYP